MAEFLFQTVNLADMVFALLAGAFDLGDDRGLFVVQDNHDRHGERGDVFQIAFGQGVFKAVAAQDFDQRVIVDLELFVAHDFGGQSGFGYGRTQKAGH